LIFFQNKVNLREQLPKYFDGQIKLLTTACALSETDWLGPELYGAFQIMKTFGTHTCSHAKTKAIGASKCVLSMIKPDNSERYIVATQDNNLKECARKVPGVPVLYLHNHAPTLEKPSDESISAAETKNLERMEVSAYQKEMLTEMKTQAFGEAPVPEYKGTRKKKAGGPNPLSCKTKKKKPSMKRKEDQNCVSVDKKKRKRIKLKIPTHIKQMKKVAKDKK